MNALLSAMRQTVLASELRRAAIFAPCSGETIRRVALHTEVLTLSRGKHLFRENAPAPAVFVVQRGAIRLTHQTILGTEQVVHIFRPHESLAEDTLVAGRRCWGTAVAAEESQILAVQRDGLLEVMKDDPELSLSLLAALGRQSQMLVNRIRDLTSKDVQTRMVTWLLEHCPDSHSGHHPAAGDQTLGRRRAGHSQRDVFAGARPDESATAGVFARAHLDRVVPQPTDRARRVRG